LTTPELTQKLPHSNLTLSSSQTIPRLARSDDFGAVGSSQFSPLPLLFKLNRQIDIPSASSFCLSMSPSGCLLLGLAMVVVGNDR